MARELASRIADGSLPPGSKLPGETVLARSLGVSRPTVREAIRTLAARHLLAVRPRSGTYVTGAPLPAEEILLELPVEAPERLWELVEIRRILDPAVAALAAARHTPANLAALAAALTRVEGTGKQEGSQIHEAYRCFFAELGRAGRNALLRRLAGSVLAAALRAFPGEILYAVAAGGRGGELGLRAIYSAVERSDGEAARRSTGQHLLTLERRLRDSGPPD